MSNESARDALAVAIEHSANAYELSELLPMYRDKCAEMAGLLEDMTSMSQEIVRLQNRQAELERSMKVERKFLIIDGGKPA